MWSRSKGSMRVEGFRIRFQGKGSVSLRSFFRMIRRGFPGIVH